MYWYSLMDSTDTNRKLLADSFGKPHHWVNFFGRSYHRNLHGYQRIKSDGELRIYGNSC